MQSELYQIELETDEIFREMHTARDREESFRELNGQSFAVVLLVWMFRD